MRVHHLLVVLAWGSTVTSKLSTPFRRLVFDVSKQLNGTLDNDTLITSYIQTLTSQHATKDQKLSILYSIECDEPLDCKEKFNETKKLAMTINNILDLDLILSWTVPQELLDDGYLLSKDLVNAWKDALNISWVQSLNANLLINHPKTVECRNPIVALGDLSRIIEPIVPGFGYDESHIKCSGCLPFQTTVSFHVVYFSFGETVGVTESFGLFLRRVSFLHSRQQSFLKKLSTRAGLEITETLYYPYKESVGDVCHQKILQSFGKQSLEGHGHQLGLIIQAPDLKPNERPEENKFNLIANMHMDEIPDSPGIIKAVSQYFDSVFLHQKKWKDLPKFADARQNQLNVRSNSDSEVPLEIILYGWWEEEGIFNASSKLIEWNATKEFRNINIGAIVFPLFGDPYKKPSKYVDQIEELMSLHVPFGCLAGNEYYWEHNREFVDRILRECNDFNSSLYYLENYLWLKENAIDSEIYSFFYENRIRRELQDLYKMGNIILKRYPNARIVLSLQFESEIDWYSNVTNFCHDDTLHINEYYEAVVNWAKCHNVEIILKFPISKNKHHQLGIEVFSAWLSYLKPVSGELNSYRIHKLATLHPYFVLRNYPKHINNWNVDPCIHWETGRPEIRANYFHNKHVGTIFDADQLRQNGTITEQEYKIMLQFVMHRFYLAEIILPNIVADFFAACNWLASWDRFNDGNNQILLNYLVPKTADDQKDLDKAQTLTSILNALKDTKLNSIIGLHFEFPNLMSCQEDPTHPLFGTKNSFVEAQQKNFKFGFLTNYKCCMEYIERLVMQNASSSQILSLLEQVDYLVCADEHQIKNLQNRKIMGNVLDSQLYVKKAFQEISPKHELYFRITLTDLPNAGSAYSDAYMKTVSHFMQSGAAYGISYLIIQAFDEQSRTNGWWEIKNFTDLSDPFTFVEKEPEYTNQQMWRPSPLATENTIDSEINSDIVVIVFVAAGIILTLCLVISSYIYLRYRRLARFLSDDEVKEFLNGRSNAVVTAEMGMELETRGNAEYMKFKTEYELHLSELQIDTQTILGSGAFGTVYRGIAKEMPVAVKQPNRDCSKTCFKSVLSEVKILCYIGDHPNIVGFMGAYTKEIYKGILYIATEFCSNGALEPFLRRKKNVVVSQQEHLNLSIPQRECTLFLEDLYRFCFEVASGMEHIEKNIVHGDLAARNVLLDDNYTCKIGDFGLSRKMYDYQKYVKTSQEPLPWKWMAHESLTRMEFTSKSDVWSFGVTIWEIFSLGSIPYSTFNWTIEFPDELKNGLRLTKPEFASENIYLKMLDCWNLEPERRPSFTDLVAFFKEMHNESYTVLQEDQ